MWTCKEKEQRTEWFAALFAASLIYGSFFILENDLFLFARVVQCFGRAAPAMEDIRNNYVAALNHPFVSAQNSVSSRHGFQRRIDGFVISLPGQGAVEIGQHQNQPDVAVSALQPAQHIGAQAVKRAIAAQEKLACSICEYIENPKQANFVAKAKNTRPRNTMSESDFFAAAQQGRWAPRR